MEIILRNSFGTLDLKFPRYDKKEKWVKKLQEKIYEMKVYHDSINDSGNQMNHLNKKIDNNIINFGIELKIGNANFDLIEDEKDIGNKEKEKRMKERKNIKNTSLMHKFRETIEPKRLFSFTIYNLKFELITKHLTNNVGLSIDNIKLVDNYPEHPSFGVLIKNSVSKNVQKNSSVINYNGSDSLLRKGSSNENIKMESKIKFLINF